MIDIHCLLHQSDSMSNPGILLEGEKNNYFQVHKCNYIFVYHQIMSFCKWILLSFHFSRTTFSKIKRYTTFQDIVLNRGKKTCIVILYKITKQNEFKPESFLENVSLFLFFVLVKKKSLKVEPYSQHIFTVSFSLIQTWSISHFALNIIFWLSFILLPTWILYSPILALFHFHERYWILWLYFIKVVLLTQMKQIWNYKAEN